MTNCNDYIFKVIETTLVSMHCVCEHILGQRKPLNFIALLFWLRRHCLHNLLQTSLNKTNRLEQINHSSNSFYGMALSPLSCVVL